MYLRAKEQASEHPKQQTKQAQLQQNLPAKAIDATLSSCSEGSSKNKNGARMSGKNGPRK
jgi:hypothetical protein